MISIVKEPYEIGIQMYRRDHEQIIALRLSNMGLKVSSVAHGLCFVFDIVIMFWP